MIILLVWINNYSELIKEAETEPHPIIKLIEGNVEERGKSVLY